MNRFSLLLLAAGLAATASLDAAEPITFQELSLMVRTGESPQQIVNDVAQRKLLQALTPEQDQTLGGQGAPPALLNALHAANLVATPDEVALYQAHHSPKNARAALAAPLGLPEREQAAAQPQPIILSDRFSEGLEASKTVPQRPVKATDAFSFSQLAEAKAQAQRDRKPLGFIMVGPTMFGKPVTTREAGSPSALLHFCEAFKDSLVLVFVPLDTKTEQLPGAVQAGFARPEINGAAPSLVAVDATANALIVAMPCGNAKTIGTDRDTIFKIGATAIQRWLTYHPMAIATANTTPPAAATSPTPATPANPNAATAR